MFWDVSIVHNTAIGNSNGKTFMVSRNQGELSRQVHSTEAQLTFQEMLITLRACHPDNAHMITDFRDFTGCQPSFACPEEVLKSDERITIVTEFRSDDICLGTICVYTIAWLTSRKSTGGPKMVAQR